MHPVLLYLLKMLLCSGILYGYYRVALYNERFHRWNRFYLLAAILLSFIVPFIEISVTEENTSPGLLYVIETWPATVVAKAAPLFTTGQIIWAAAAIVSIVLFVRLFVGLYATIYKPYIKGQVTAMDEISIVVTETPAAPYSFFKWLFWRSDLDPDSAQGKRVLEHELTHIREKHSSDKLFVELVLVICWFNPFFWLIRKELYVIHEFLADRRAIEHNNGAAFAEMILKTMNPGYTSPLTNPFFTSQLKRRLKMITTSNKPQFSYLRRISALVAMVAVSFVLMLTIEKGMAQKTPPAPPPPPMAPPPPPVQPMPDSIKSITIKEVNGKSIATIRLKNGIVRTMPVDEAIDKGYPVPPPPPPAPPAPLAPPPPPAPKAPPTAAELRNIPPDDIVSITIDEPNNHAWVKLKNKTFFDLPLLDAQCLIDASPEKVTRKNNLFNLGSEEPLYVYAGLDITKEQMAQIDPNMIESIDVLKGEKAIAAYGEKGKHGVIRITPKSQGYSQKSMEGQRMGDVVVVGYGSKENVIKYPVPPKMKVAHAIRGKNDGENPPLYVLNGKVVSTEEGSSMEPNEIESINVLKGEAAVNKYGAVASHGAVEIMQKNDAAGTKIFTQIEQMPKFPGGPDGWRKHLQRNLRYPDEAQNKGTQGIAKISFIVNTDGSMVDFKIIEDPGAGLGQEALRVIKDGPKWEPGMQNGRIVNCRITQNITFRLE